MLVDGESDAEKFDSDWREAKYLKPQEAAELLRVDARTVKRWAQSGKLNGFRTPGGHWRISEGSVRAMQRGNQSTGLLSKTDDEFYCRGRSRPRPVCPVR